MSEQPVSINLGTENPSHQLVDKLNTILPGLISDGVDLIHQQLPILWSMVPTVVWLSIIA